MKLVTYLDDDGFKRQSFLREDMPDNQAHMGIPLNPPDLSQLDCNELMKELNDLLIERSLFTLKEINGNNLLRSSVETVFFRAVYNLYKTNHPTGSKKSNAPKKKS
jgi:hypothetical protein